MFQNKSSQIGMTGMEKHDAEGSSSLFTWNPVQRSTNCITGTDPVSVLDDLL